MSVETELSDYEEHEWCYRKRQVVFVHRYGSRFCRKIISTRNEAAKSILRKTKASKSLQKVRFVEEEAEILSSCKNRTTKVFCERKKKGKPPKKLKLFLEKSAEERAALKPLTSNHFENPLLSEYDSFEKSPTISLPTTAKEMSNQSVRFLFDRKPSQKVEHASTGLLTPTENVQISPEYVKFNKRIKKRSSFSSKVKKEEILEKRQNCVDGFKPAGVLRTTTISNEALPTTNTRNVPEKASVLLPFDFSTVTKEPSASGSKTIFNSSSDSLQEPTNEYRKRRLESEKMPRTKQTKPRHITEDLKTKPGEEAKSETSSHSENNHCGQVSDADQCDPKSQNWLQSPATSDCVGSHEEMADDAIEETALDLKENQTDVAPHKNSEIHDDSTEINICGLNGANSNSFSQSNEDRKHVILDYEENVDLKDCEAQDNKNGTYTGVKEVNEDITSPSVEPQPLADNKNVENVAGENIQSASPKSNASFEVKEKQPANGLHKSTPDSTTNNASSYYSTLQSLSENGAQKNFEAHTTAWKSWLNSLENPYKTNSIALANNSSSLVNGYLKQFTEYWNSLLHHDLKSNNFYSDSHVTQKDFKSNISDSVSYAKDLGSASCLEQQSSNNIADEKTLVRNASTSSSFASSSGILSERQDLGNNISPVFPENSDPKENNKNCERKFNRQDECDSTSHSNQTRSQSNEISAENPVSKSHNRSDSYGHSPSLTSYGSWSNPAWPYYSSPHYSDYSYSLPAKSSREILRKSSSSSEKSASVEEKLSPFNQSTSIMYNGDQFSYQSPRQKHSDCNSIRKKSGTTSTAMEAFQRQYNLPYMPLYNSLWYGSQLPFNSSLSYPYGSMLNAFSPDMASLGALAGSNGMSSLSESTGYLSSLPYKRDSASFSPSMEKMLSSRRSRAKGFAFDNFHAEIVKKAKEQSKGVDPENMYIQCPICEKRIKRLYHFQRHMRIHTGEKTHQCPNCQYKSVRKDNLKSHMKTHEKQNLEIGRKGGKTSFQISSSSDIASESSHNRALESSADSNGTNETKSNDMPQDICLDLTASSKSVHKTKNSISPAEINGFKQYSNFITNSYALPDSAHAHVTQKKSTSASPYNLNDSVMNVKAEDELQKDRSKYASLTGMVDVCGRPHYKVASDVLKKDGGFLKRGIEAVQDCHSNKRMKVVDITPDSGASASKAINNSNNNNDSDDHYSMETQFARSISNRGMKNRSGSKIDVDLPSHVSRKENSLSDLKSGEIVEMSNQSSNSRFDSPLHFSPKDQPSTAASAHQPTAKDIASNLTATGSTAPGSAVEEHTIENETRRDGKNSVQTNHDATNSVATSAPFFPSRHPLHFYDTSKYSMFVNGLSFPTISQPSAFFASQVNPLVSANLTTQELTNHTKDELFKKIKQKERKASQLHYSSDVKNGKAKNLQDSSLPSKLLQCRLCPYNTISNIELQAHVTSKHKQDGFYKCEECSYLGKNLSKLVEHIRIHTGERPFKCDQCNYAAKRKDNLAQHKAVRHDKKKAKSGSHYPTIPEIKQDSAHPDNHHFMHGMKQTKKMTTPPTCGKNSLLNQHSMASRLNAYGGFSHGKEQNYVNTSSTSLPLTPSLQSFAAMHAFSSSLFSYPYFPQNPTTIGGAELENSFSGPASKPVSNANSYSMKVHAALIAP